MLRAASIAALLTALAFVSSSIASPGGAGRIAFVNDTGLYEVNADGTDAVLIRPSGCARADCRALETPRWSRDGTQIVFIHVVSTGDTRMYAIDANGDNERLLGVSPTPPDPSLALSRQTWAPDSATITFGPGPQVDWGDIYTMPVDGHGHGTRRTFDAMPMQAAVWSPNGKQLAYSRYVQAVRYRSELFVLSLSGGAPTQITDSGPGRAVNDSPVWSPDGSLLAFSRAVGDDSRAIYVIRPDGRGMRRVSSVSGDLPAWSSDGRSLAFTSSSGSGSQIYVVNADGSHERRLTDLVDGVRDDDVTWEPNDARLLFTRTAPNAKPVLYTVNPDGTCERRLTRALDGRGGAWQPGTGGAENRCRTIRADVTTSLIHRSSGASVRVAVANSGNERIESVRVVIPRSGDFSPTGATSPGGHCALGSAVTCSLGRLGPGQRAVATVWVEARRVTRSKLALVTVRVEGEGADDQAHQQSRLRFGKCGTTTEAKQRVVGTRGSDQLCGGRADDRLQGGSGNDQLRGGAGKDLTVGGPGRDTIFARDGFRDRITCGRGRDVVFADRLDRVARDCERVRRR
ncbi:MAG TPA: hypothetical protein VH420_00475 [Gaiellaceae bacterium]